MEAMGRIRELANNKEVWKTYHLMGIPFELPETKDAWNEVDRCLKKISRDHGVQAAQAAADYASRLTGHTWSVIDYTADIPF